MIETVFQSAVMIAAGQGQVRVWGRFDHGEASFGTGHLLTIAGIAAILIVIAVARHHLAKRAKRTFSSDNPTRLFRELCAAHGLKRSKRRFLQQLAAAHGITNPAALFVEPQHFELKSLPAELKISPGELRRLRQKLFDGRRN
jgi:hypothetical protein